MGKALGEARIVSRSSYSFQSHLVETLLETLLVFFVVFIFFLPMKLLEGVSSLQRKAGDLKERMPL